MSIIAQTFRPSARVVQDLDVGSIAPDEFGNLRRVAEVYARGEDLQGRPFVCVNLERGDCLVSASYKVGERHASVSGWTTLPEGEGPDLADLMEAIYLGGHREGLEEYRLGHDLFRVEVEG